jgi:transposase
MLTQEVVNMGQTRRAFTREFKQEAVKLVTAGKHPTAQVARDLGLTPNLLRRWKQEVSGDPVAAFPGKGRRKPHEEELARLKRDLARVTQERDFLKSVAADFAKPSS